MTRKSPHPGGTRTHNLLETSSSPTIGVDAIFYIEAIAESA